MSSSVSAYFDYLFVSNLQGAIAAGSTPIPHPPRRCLYSWTIPPVGLPAADSRIAGRSLTQLRGSSGVRIK
ncbi:MAG: hypothetical protein KME19_10765 [Microcoleus vaginatus WJT46-NPBG5]|nr:hypothetical protein [Microcoleus vaginatus WJT46-NPBG5]